MSSIGEKRKCATEDTRTITSCRIIVSKNIVQGGTKSRQNYIPRNVDPKGDGAQDAIAQMFAEPMFDHKQWPASIRFMHQNVAPGGVAAHDEAATRERWGYPKPFTVGAGGFVPQ